MDTVYPSVFEALLNKRVIDSHTRNVAGLCVKRYLQEMIDKHNLYEINEEDVEELAFELVDELCAEDYTHFSK